jgi:Carboxypeptidase regulatory-like domain
LFVAAHVLLPWVASAQGLTGTLVGTVKDWQGGALVGALVEISSPALIGGPGTTTTNSKGQLRFTNLPPGPYGLLVAVPGFTTYRAQDVLIGVSTTTDVAVILQLAGVTQSVEVEGTSPRMGGRNPGVGTRFGPEDLAAIPTRRAGVFDLVRAAPGISPTSPSSGTINTISAFGSGTNENSFLIDGTDFTSPSNGAARADPGVDFVQKVHIQSVGDH